MERLFRIYATLFARPSLYRLHRFLFQLSIRGMGVLNWTSEKVCGERDLLKRLVPPTSSGIVLDVGANKGEYSQFLTALAPQLQIHAFEPHPKTFATLRGNVAGTTICCHHAAVGSRSGKAHLFDYATSDGSGHATLYESVIERIHSGTSISHEIKTIRLDEFLAERAISEVFLLKVDVEGGELDVLRGLSGFLADPSKSIEFIQLEFNEMNVVSRVFFRDVLDELKGFRAYRILPRGRLVEITHERPLFTEVFAFQNILFTKSAIAV